MSKETSEEIASLAARVLTYTEMTGDETEFNSGFYNNLLEEAKKLAGSCLVQREPQEYIIENYTHIIHGLRGGLIEASNWFRDYEQQHSLKDGIGARFKETVNKTRAEFCVTIADRALDFLQKK